MAVKDDMRRERTLAWARDFRAAAVNMGDPPGNIAPVIWEAMRTSYLRKAEELEAEAKELNDE